MPVPAGSFSGNNQSVIATGGTITNIPGWTAHSYTGVGNSSFSVIKGTLPIEYVIVAGGGAGGYVSGSTGSSRTGGGAGAGGYRSSVQGELSGGSSSPETPFEPQPLTTYSVSVGAGGVAQVNQNRSGDSSAFAGITSTGGGPGGHSSRGGHLGTFGSAGGGGRQDNAIHARPSPITGQGNFGGFAVNRNSTNNSGGGGGGAGQDGADGTSTTSVNNGGNGGGGIRTFIRNTSGEWLAGGGGGGSVASITNRSAGSGGIGGGGDGSLQNGGVGAGSSNTGGGGGGRSRVSANDQPGGSGGSGIVIVRYNR